MRTGLLLILNKTKYFTKRREKKYHLSNQTEYKYYKLEIKENRGGPSTQIAEWHLHGYINCSDLEARNTGQTFSSLTPMGHHFVNKPETTRRNQGTWLNTAENEPTITDGEGRFQWVAHDVTLCPLGKPLPADINQLALETVVQFAALAAMAYVHPTLYNLSSRIMATKLIQSPCSTQRRTNKGCCHFQIPF